MEMSNDQASSTSFRIGPSTIIGRTIAFRVLFCTSSSHLRRRISHLLSSSLSTFKNTINSHGKHGINLAITATLIFFLLMKVSWKAESGDDRRKFWRNYMMKSARSYEEWANAARMIANGSMGLIKRSESEFYDEELLRIQLKGLRERRERGSLGEMVFCMRADLVRNLGNMCNPKLHIARLQVPTLIKEYIDEVSTQLRMVCDSESEEFLLEEKLAFMHETRHAFGRTALLLSGGASLGAFHVGVVRTLVEHKLLPRIIAGSSVGSIVCAIVATRSWPELETFFEDSLHSLEFFDKMGGIFTAFKRIMTQGAVHEISHLQRLLRHLTSNLTFQEAYDMTGRILGITVCSPRKHEPPRCLNYLTSPHVLIWSAVTASCAFPGLFEAQELMAKNRSGDIVPFHVPFLEGPQEEAGTSARRWRDGSLENDLPMMQLKELFNVNHFIVSQTNPHITPLLRLKELVSSYGGKFAAKLAHLVEMEVKHRCNQILELGFPLGGVAKLFAQDWEGDVTVVMPATLAQYSKIIQNPSHVELQKAINQGRRCTWEKLSAIKANCAIELVLDECVALLNHMRRLKRNAARAATSLGVSATLKASPSRRIPSWNRIARENSTGSIDEDLVADVAASIHQGSDSESESTDLNNWTRSGGPLLMTASASKLTQDLDIESELNGIRSREEETDGLAVQCNSNSITVPEGDLLQPERTHNGIVLNVVKKEDLNLASITDGSEQLQSSPEVLEILQRESCNGSVVSDCSEDDEAKLSCTDDTKS